MSVGMPTTTKLSGTTVPQTGDAMILHLKHIYREDHAHNGCGFSVTRGRGPDTSDAANEKKNKA